MEENTPVIIIGAGSFAHLLKYYLEEYTAHSVVAFAVHAAYITERDKSEDIPIVPLEELVERYPPTSHCVILGVGYTKMNSIRQELFRQCKNWGYFVESFIHPSAFVERNVSLGEGNIILERVNIAACTSIGNGNLMFNNVMIGHDGVIGDFNTFSVGVTVAGRAVFDDCCFVGVGCTVLNRIHIRSYSLCGAGAVISKDTEKYSVTAHARSVTLDKLSVDIW